MPTIFVEFVVNLTQPIFQGIVHKGQQFIMVQRYSLQNRFKKMDFKFQIKEELALESILLLITKKHSKLQNINLAIMGLSLSVEL